MSAPSIQVVLLALSFFAIAASQSIVLEPHRRAFAGTDAVFTCSVQISTLCNESDHQRINFATVDFHFGQDNYIETYHPNVVGSFNSSSACNGTEVTAQLHLQVFSGITNDVPFIQCYYEKQDQTKVFSRAVLLLLAIQPTTTTQPPDVTLTITSTITVTKEITPTPNAPADCLSSANLMSATATPVPLSFAIVLIVSIILSFYV